MRKPHTAKLQWIRDVLASGPRFHKFKGFNSNIVGQTCCHHVLTLCTCKNNSGIDILLITLDFSHLSATLLPWYLLFRNSGFRARCCGRLFTWKEVEKRTRKSVTCWNRYGLFLDKANHLSSLATCKIRSHHWGPVIWFSLWERVNVRLLLCTALMIWPIPIHFCSRLDVVQTWLVGLALRAGNGALGVKWGRNDSQTKTCSNSRKRKARSICRCFCKTKTKKERSSDRSNSVLSASSCFCISCMMAKC